LLFLSVRRTENRINDKQILFTGVPTRVFNRPEFSGRHDFQAEKFGRQCTKSGSQAAGLQEKSNLMQNKT